MTQRSLLAYAGLFLCSLVALATLAAAEPEPPPRSGEWLGGQLHERLALSDEQQSAVQPFLEAYAVSLRSIRARREAGELSRLAGARELRAARKERDSGIEPLLNAEQREEYAALKEELRAEGRGRLKARRKGISGE